MDLEDVLDTVEDAVPDVPNGIGAGRQIVGGPGDDSIEGTGGSDEILADPVPADDQGGDDQVWGYGGDDRIYGFGGDNRIYGGPGDDELITADGVDLILGGPGDDEIQGGRNTDLLHGGPGDDEIRGGEGDDTLYGDAGVDRVIGSSGNDLLYGGLGADQLEGREGADRFAWNSADEGRDTVLDYEVGVDGLLIGDFLRGYSGAIGALERYVRITDGVLQVDADGRGGGSWRDLGLIQGHADLQAAALYRVGDLTLEGHDAPPAFGPLSYIASHDDLIEALSANALAGKRHYINNGYAEGRAVTFDGLQYVASHIDLIGALGADARAGADHFIRFGRAEERERDSFDEVQYVANYTDLQRAFGDDYEAATSHFIAYGQAEGRKDEPLAAGADFIF